MNERKLYVDYIKAFGILLVIAGHINFANELQKGWIYSFHMPVFFFAAGLTAVKLPIDSFAKWKQRTKKRIHRLLVPYFLWAFLYSQFSWINFFRILYGSYATISATNGLSSLWFLPVMFLATSLFDLLKYIEYNLKEKDRKNLYILSILIAATIAGNLPSVEEGYPFCLDVSILALSFLILGSKFEEFIEKIDMFTVGNWNVKHGFLCFIGFLGTITYHVNLANCDGNVLMANMRIGNLFWFLICAFSGCIMLYGLAKVLEERHIKSKILQFIGKNSLAFFLLHKPVIGLFERLFEFWCIPMQVQLLVTLFGVTLICYYISNFLYKWAPFLFGSTNEDKVTSYF